MGVKRDLTLDEAIDQVGRKFALNESIGDDGINNMDIEGESEGTSIVPFQYKYAIRDHKRKLERGRELSKDVVKAAEEVVKENEREAHSKVVKNDNLKKMKLEESFFEDWKDNLTEGFDPMVVKEATKDIKNALADFRQMWSYVNECLRKGDLMDLYGMVEYSSNALRHALPDISKAVEKARASYTK